MTIHPKVLKDRHPGVVSIARYFEDPPEDRPTKRASDSIGRRQKYPPDGLKK